MDVVYVLGPRQRNDELRYSLRSLVNIPHDRVWIAGAPPPRGIKSDGFISVPQRGTRFEHSTVCLEAAAKHPDVSESFVLMNDDFFVMREMDQIPVLHGGSAIRVKSQYVRSGATTFARSMRSLVAFLNGNGPPRSYELHVPMVMEKAKVRELFTLGCPHEALCVLKRSLYGNHFQVGGSFHGDVKVGRKSATWSSDWPFLSTSDGSFHTNGVGDHVRAAFPDPSAYEVPR